MTHVILAGNYRQAKDYLKRQQPNLDPRQTVIVSEPHNLRGLRGPLKVHRVGTYWEDRPLAFLSLVESDIRMIERTSS